MQSLMNENLFKNPLHTHVTFFTNDEIADVIMMFRVDGIGSIVGASDGFWNTLDKVPLEAVQTELDGMKMIVKVVDYNKCERCYKLMPEVGKNKWFPDLCERCVRIVCDIRDNLGV